MRHDVSCYIYGGQSDSGPLEAISSICEGTHSGVVRCSSAVRNAIEHDMQVNSGLSSCAAVCVSVIRDSHQVRCMKKSKRGSEKSCESHLAVSFSTKLVSHHCYLKRQNLSFEPGSNQ